MALLLTPVAPQAGTATTLHSAIPPQSLRTALAAWAAQTHLQVVYLSSVVREQQSPGASSGLAADAALVQLLRGTGLQFEFLSPALVRIRTPPTAAPALAADSPPIEQEVVVTAATSREGPQAPRSQIVWSRDELDASRITNVVRLADLTPGVTFDSYQAYGSGIENNIVIRGVNALDGSTVAVYLDDTPIPSDRASIFGRAFPLLFDLDHVQIMRGPQGVLMGEGAEGGAIRFVRAQPSASVFTAAATAEYSTTEHGAPSHEWGGELGTPLWPDRLGLRVSAWSRRDGGFVDRVDPYSGEPQAVNSDWIQRDTFSGALGLELAPRVSLALAMDYQSINVNDSSAFFTALSSPGTGILRNGKPSQQPYLDRYDLPSLRVVAELDFGRLVSETAFFDRWASAVDDTTDPNLPHGPPVTPGTVQLSLEQRFISEHLQLESTDPTARLQWVLGAAYLHAHYLEIQDLVNLALAEAGGINGRLSEDLGTKQIAAFGQADIKLGNQLTATAGLRVERWSYDSSSVVVRGPPDDFPQYFSTRDDSTVTTPRVALSYRPADDRLYYVSAAKGYRAGGYNVPLGAACGTPTPATYAPDSVWSFELGDKGSWFDGRLQHEISLFHAAWRNLQLQIPYEQCGFGYTSNAATAASDGIELGIAAELSNRLNLKLTAAYADARYTQTVYFDGRTVVQSGDAVGALPLVQPPFSASAIATYAVPVREAVVTLRAQDSFHSRNPGPFSTDNPNGLIYMPERRPDPAFSQVDLSVTAQWRSLELSAFALNLFNSQPTLQASDRYPGGVIYATTLRPRTIGISVTWQLQKPAAGH